MGVGLELVRVYLSAGHDVVATCRDATKAAALDGLANDHPGKLSIHEMELTDEASMRALSSTLDDTALFVDYQGEKIPW